MSNPVRLSVVMPTIARPTLAYAVESAVSQFAVGDELIMVADGCQPAARALADTHQAVRYLEAHDPASRYGNRQRDVGAMLARGTHLLFLDDDDAYLPGALDTIRAAVASEPDRAHVFRMRFGAGHCLHGLELWERPELEEGNVGTPMVVLPNRPYRLTWLEAQLRARSPVVSDYVFLTAAIGECGEPVWHRMCIAVVRS